ncbi:DUF4249 domain-containing protein [Rhodocytophaga rosea]|uniref:DUF4249 domain-containing protein n=1 Tax=Rhodocytophaga rosea TaxID=2704465 RepID=A0A6C0GLE4_9BACT|nr:DUF4249 domain-containing protein [Rhodocytophaga rosea]QHT68901.1 DUF4249 domain-containing protein [Rhodocytophaga rosea]
MKVVFISALIILGLFSSCIDEVQLPIRNEEPRLVVEGMITNELPPYSVRLTYSGSFQSARDIPNELFISNAQVKISDEQGNEAELFYTDQGTYQTRDSLFIGQVGKTYQLTIQLTDGKKYVSQPEKMAAVPAIDSLYSEYVDTWSSERREPGYMLYADLQDPQETEDYYRWSGFSFLLKRATGVPCVIGSPQIICYEYCWLPNYSSSVHILTDDAVNGNKIRKQNVYYSPIFTIGSHLVEISQQSLTKEAYQFWKRFDEQVTRVGSILDPLPSTIAGNITNVNDANDQALGYFSASAIVRKRLVIISDLPRFDIDIQTSGFIKQGDCRVAYPGGTLEKPAGW